MKKISHETKKELARIWKLELKYNGEERYLPNQYLEYLR